MENYLKAKKIRVTNQMADDVLNELIGEEDSDEEMQSIASSGSDEPQVRRGADVNDEDSEVGKFGLLSVKVSSFSHHMLR
jgi:hypothetical protein